ncbi:DUF3231 family protein [Bacillus sp. DJP31]|uniref:DUF3231 family protein n=1 Tax=Bacillus sp. DJP31 TaxID=3409789 RepID=UPI003BB78848
MQDKTRIQLTASEISGLWGQFINDSTSVCVLSHFLAKVEDEEVKPVIEFALLTSKKHLSIMKQIFHSNGFPTPIGFTDKDVNVNAPKLFSDTFVLMYLRHKSILVMAASSLAIGIVTRPDCVAFHKEVLKGAVLLQDQTRELMLKLGIYIRPPYISRPDRVDFVQKQSFLSGFIGEIRPLTSLEVTHLFINVQKNAIGKALIMAFAQCAKNDEVMKYFLRGKKIAHKHMDLFSNILKNDDLPAPMSWDTAVTDSTSPPFSDKLMLFHITAMIAAGIGNYGVAMGASPRRDIGMKYASLIPEIALYAEDGANIMIKNGWLEEPPQTDNREKLAKQK